MTDLNLDAIMTEVKEMRGRVEKAHGGDWYPGRQEIYSNLNESTDGYDLICDFVWDRDTQDFIILSHTDLPRACDLIDSLIEKVKELEGKCL